MYGDEEYMNDEIIEALCEYSSQQQTVVSPMDGNEIDQYYEVDSHVSSLEINEHIQQFSNDQNRDEDSYSNCSSYHLLPEYLCQEEYHEIHIYDVENTEILIQKSTCDIEFQGINELIGDSCASKLQEDIEKEISLIESVEIKRVKQDSTPIESTNSGFLDSQDDLPVEIYEGTFSYSSQIYKVADLFECTQEYIEPCLAINDVKYE